MSFEILPLLSVLHVPWICTESSGVSLKSFVFEVVCRMYCVYMYIMALSYI